MTPKKYVKCINDTGRTDYLRNGAVYEVEAERAVIGRPHYCLRGVTSSHASFRFVEVGADISVICVDDSNSNGYLTKGYKYTVELDPSDEAQYIIRGLTLKHWLKERFVLDNSVTKANPPPIAKVVDDKVAELSFFKRRADPNECACGGTRGVCPDHPL